MEPLGGLSAHPVVVPRSRARIDPVGELGGSLGLTIGRVRVFEAMMVSVMKWMGWGSVDGVCCSAR
jgi:hypothetical protein